MMTKNWETYYAELDPRTVMPAEVLLDYEHLLPPKGRALDLACGLGANACLLASRGLETMAWDRSSTAIHALRSRAASENLPLVAEVRDVVLQPPPPASFDVLVVSRFLDRRLGPALSAALRPEGLLFYQTFGPPLNDRPKGPRQSIYRLSEMELPHMFPTLHMRVYREEGACGDVRFGLRNEVYAIFEQREELVFTQVDG